MKPETEAKAIVALIISLIAFGCGSGAGIVMGFNQNDTSIIKNNTTPEMPQIQTTQNTDITQTQPQTNTTSNTKEEVYEEPSNNQQDPKEEVYEEPSNNQQDPKGV
jgi:hypothetical protein